MVSLGAQLKEIPQQKSESLNTYLDLKGQTLLSNILLARIKLCLVNRCPYLPIITPFIPQEVYKGIMSHKSFNHEESYSSRNMFTLDENTV